MNSRLKILLLILLMLSTCHLFAIDRCQELSGSYRGYYQDLGHLFPSGNYPISLTLRYNNGQIVGYSQKEDDQIGPNIGKTPYLFHAICHNNHLSNVTFISSKRRCGRPFRKTLLVKSAKTLKLYLQYENAMIDTELYARLKRIKPASQLNQKLIRYAQNLQFHPIHTCH